MKPCLILLFFLMVFTAHAQEPAKVEAAPTFHSVGLSWKPQGGSVDIPCQVHYRAQGEENWHQAMPLWFDKRNNEYRGSIVHLEPGTTYTVKLQSGEQQVERQFRTWSESFPIAREVILEPGNTDKPLVITQGGSLKDGYVLYTVKAGGERIIDVQNKHNACIEIKASFVIVRGLTLRGAKADGVRLHKVRNVVIEDCDISGWGRKGKDAFGQNFDSAIRGMRKGLQYIIIQRNRIHHPRYGSSNWGQKSVQKYHPDGPQGISWPPSKGNIVIRYNEITSDDKRGYNDAMGWHDNFSDQGFPGPNSDVYGNIISHCWDDGLELEGGGENLRVWNNYIHTTMVGIATASVTIGPTYVWRNVFVDSRWMAYPDGDSDRKVNAGPRASERNNRGNFGKIGDTAKFGPSRQYWLHNTTLQPMPKADAQLTLGANSGFGVVADGIGELVWLNNITHIFHHKDQPLTDLPSYRLNPEKINAEIRVDYDLYNGTTGRLPENQMANGIRQVPVYKEGHGVPGVRDGLVELADDSPGIDAALRLPNFNDGFQGKGPDIGAGESGGAPLRWGIHAGKRAFEKSLGYDKHSTSLKNQERFETLLKLDWESQFVESGKGDWKERWFLDGEQARITMTDEGIDFSAGPTPRTDEGHAVLWTNESFTGSMLIRYKYTRKDDANKFVNIAYLYAEGDGEKDRQADIAAWADQRKVASMRRYFGGMNLLHISYAAFTNDGRGVAYIRGRQYEPKRTGGKLNGTELIPDYNPENLFAKDVEHQITILKHETDLYFLVETDQTRRLCHWDLSKTPKLDSGRFGLRHMASRIANYSSLSISTLKD